MGLRQWSKSNFEYGRKVLRRGLEGARSGREAFLEEPPAAPFLTPSVRTALKGAALGVCIGVLGGGRGQCRPSLQRAFTFGFLGAAVGFGAGSTWKHRDLAARAISGAWKSIAKVRDEHWLETHPIDYA